MIKALHVSKRRFGFFEELSVFALRKLMLSRRRKLVAKHKQMACFAFDLIGIEINISGIYGGNDLDALFMYLLSANPDIAKGAAIDIGANIGNHSLYFSDHFAKVFSFEPNKQTFQVLKVNASLANNIECYNCGISNKNSEAWMVFNKVNVGGARVVSTSQDNSVAINLATLDAMIRREEKINFIKIDVEGHEYEALQGSEETIRRNMPIIMFEQHAKEVTNGSSASLDLLRSFGYSRFLILETLPSSVRFLPRYASYFLVFIWRCLFGERRHIVVKEYFESRFYSFIIAVPDAMVLCLPEGNK